MDIIKRCLFVLLLATTFLCCDTSNEEGPEINLENPQNGQVYSSGDTIFITGSATDNGSVEQVILDYNNEWNEEFDIVTGEFVPLYFWIAQTIVSPREITLSITATDDSGNSTTEQRVLTLEE